MALTTLARVRSSLPRLASLSDSAVNDLIAESSDLIESYCNRSFGPGPFTETFDGTGSGVVFLRSTPVASITSVTTGLPDASTILTTDQYRVDSLTGELRLGGYSQGYFPGEVGYPWSWGDFGFQSITVVYTGASTVPPSVVRVCLNLISGLSTVGVVATNIKSKSMGDVSVTYGDAAASGSLAMSDMMALNKFRRLSL